jgi:hypothetical protein
VEVGSVTLAFAIPYSLAVATKHSLFIPFFVLYLTIHACSPGDTAGFDSAKHSRLQSIFFVRTRDKDFVLRASTPALAQQWVDALKQAVMLSGGSLLDAAAPSGVDGSGGGGVGGVAGDSDPSSFHVVDARRDGSIEDRAAPRRQQTSGGGDGGATAMAREPDVVTGASRSRGGDDINARLL